MQNTNLKDNRVMLEETKYTITISIDPLEKLKALTEQEINRLNSERRNMESVHSNFDLLLKRYNLEKSYFGQISLWYGSKSWWVKILLFILVAAIGAGIGLICHMPITLVLITSAIYIFFAFFFINHYNIHQKQTKSLCEDIIELEKSLTVAINHFNELSNSLKKNLINLHEFNTQMLMDMQSMQENFHILTTQITQYKQIIFDLEQAKEIIAQATTTVRQNLVEGNKQYKECTKIFHDRASQMDLICKNLSKSDLYLQFDSDQIKNMMAKYQKTLDKISETADRLDKLIKDKQSNKETLKPDCKHNILSLASQNDLHFDVESTSQESSQSSSDDESEKITAAFNSQVLEESKKLRFKTQKIIKKLEESEFYRANMSKR
jgi:hypothetical protein